MTAEASTPDHPRATAGSRSDSCSSRSRRVQKRTQIRRMAQMDTDTATRAVMIFASLPLFHLRASASSILSVFAVAALDPLTSSLPGIRLDRLDQGAVTR